MTQVPTRRSSGRSRTLVLVALVFFCPLSNPGTSWGIPGLVVLMPAELPTSEKAAANMLPSGYPLETSLPGNAFGSIGIAGPDGSQQLTVTLTKGSGNLGLYLEYGSAAGAGTGATPGDKLLNFLADADAASSGTSTDQIIVLNADTTPPLRTDLHL